MTHRFAIDELQPFLRLGLPKQFATGDVVPFGVAVYALLG